MHCFLKEKWKQKLDLIIYISLFQIIYTFTLLGNKNGDLKELKWNQSNSHFSTNITSVLKVK